MYNPFIACKDCANRYPGCHGKCETYIKAKAEHDRLRAADMLEKDIWSYAAKTINAKRDADAK